LNSVENKSNDKEPEGSNGESDYESNDRETEGPKATWWIVTSGNKGVNSSSDGELSISFIIFNTRSKFIAMFPGCIWFEIDSIRSS
jgi:hypothetical protein